MGRQRLTAVEVGCRSCEWTYMTSEGDREKRRSAQRHADETGHTTWADSYYSTLYEPKVKNAQSVAENVKE